MSTSDIFGSPLEITVMVWVEVSPDLPTPTVTSAGMLTRLASTGRHFLAKYVFGVFGSRSSFPIEYPTLILARIPSSTSVNASTANAPFPKRTFARSLRVLLSSSTDSITPICFSGS